MQELSHDVSEQQQNHVHAYYFFSLTLDESADICDIAQLSIFIRGIDYYKIFEEVIGLMSLHGKTKGQTYLRKR